eukprot:TRINITY_DN25955_c0_g2_i5.p1 TRINITY_DN25955_c0_g2~~TRINITY_DN25955_c0_g2_i5.p1  ORF type:complete len:2991 (-),score=721.49 TRINITY_DN25955_c0_g2_i5:376-9348(-)
MPYDKPKDTGGRRDWYADAQKNLRFQKHTFDPSDFLSPSTSYGNRPQIHINQSPAPGIRPVPDTVAGSAPNLSTAQQVQAGGRRIRRKNIDTVTYGSLVHFFCQEALGYLQKNDERLQGQVMLGLEPLDDQNDIPRDFRKCIFEMMPQHKYQKEEKRQKERRTRRSNMMRGQDASNSGIAPGNNRNSTAIGASKPLKGDSDQLTISVQSWESPIDMHKYDRLRDEAVAEARENAIMVDKVLSNNTTVKYGDIVQLRHVQSDRFLMFSHRIYLHEDPSSRAHFMIKSIFSHRKEGDSISVGDNVALCPLEAAEESSASVFLSFHHHRTNETEQPEISRYLPVVCSGQMTRWRMGLYQVYDRFVKSLGGLEAGNVVWLFLPQEKRFLHTCSDHPGKVTTAKGHGKDENDRVVGTLDGLWEIELDISTRGGPVKWDGSNYRLKHVQTGYYLTMGSIDPFGNMVTNLSGSGGGQRRSGGRDDQQVRRKSHGRLSKEFGGLQAEQPHEQGQPRLMLIDPNNPELVKETQFKLFPAAKNQHIDPVVRENQQFRLRHVESGLWLQIHQEGVDQKDTGAQEKKKHHHHTSEEESILLVGGEKDMHEEDCLHFVLAAKNEVKDGIFLLRIMPAVKGYLRKCKNGVITEGHYRSGSMEKCLQHLIIFCLSENLNIRARHEEEFLTFKSDPILRRQILLRQEGVIDLAIDLLQVWWNPKLKETHGLCRLCYRLLMHMCKDCAENEVYAWELGQDVFVEHLGHELLAEQTIGELLSDNYTLLEKLDPAIVNKCVSLIDLHGKQHHYLQFLASICVCNGEGIPGNQEAICSAIFNNEKVLESVTIQVRAEKGQLEVEVSSLKNNEELVWTSLETFYSLVHPDAVYFRHLIRLYAMMCFGRMYLCKTQCERLITLEASFNSVKNEKLPTLVRAAFADFLRHVYIECEPQRIQHVPNHLRLWNSLDMTVPVPQNRVEEEPVENTLPHILNDLKMFIQEYIETKVGGNSTAGTSTCFNYKDEDRNMLTLALLEIFSSLLQCGLFSDIPRVQAIVRPLVALLDGRSDHETIFHKNPWAMTAQHHKPTGGFHSTSDPLAQLIGDTEDSDLEEDIDPNQNPSPLGSLLHASVKVAAYAANSHPTKASNSISLGQSTAKVHPASPSSIHSRSNDLSITEVLDDCSRPQCQNAEALVVCKCKLEIVLMLKYISSLWVDLNITSVMKTFRDTLTRGDTVLELDTQTMHQTLLKAGSLSSVHSKIGKIRRSICNANEPKDYDTMVDAQSDTQAVTTTDSDPETPQTWNQLADPANLTGASQLDLLAIAGEDFAAILLDLTMYANTLPGLAEQALSLLFKLSNPHSSVADEISNTQILASPEFLQVYQICSPALSKMRQQVDLAEVWMKGGTSLKNEVVRLNAMFEMLMEIMAPGKDSRVSTERQTLMYNMGTHNVVMDFIRESSYIVSQHVSHEKTRVQNETKSAKRSKKQFTSYIIIESGVFQKAYRLLDLFCRGNMKHQMLLHGELERFSAQLGAAGSRRIASLGQNHLIAAIFHSNKQLCNNVKPELIQLVAKQIETCGPLQNFLTIPRTIVMCNDSYIRVNQDLIMQYLVGFPDEDGNVGTHLGIEILANRSEALSLTEYSHKDIEQQMGYEAALVDLLAECCSDNVMAQLKCQSLIPFSVVHAQLVKPDVSGVGVSLRSSLLKFLLHVYLENDTSISVGSSLQWLELWEVQKNDMSILARAISMGNWVCTDESEFIRDASVRDGRPHEKRAWAKIDCFLSSFLPVLFKLLQIWEMELRDSATDTKNFHNFVKSIITVLHELLCGNDWVLPLVIAHDLIADRLNSHPRCCTRHASARQLNHIQWVHNLIQQVIVEDVVLPHDSPHRYILEELHRTLERSVSSTNSHHYQESCFRNLAVNETKPRLVEWFERSFEQLKRSPSWKNHERKEFDFLISSVGTSDVICGELSYASMLRLMDYLISFLEQDRSINLWTSISCLRLVEGIVMSDFSKLESADHGISHPQQKRLSSLCFDILGNRLGFDTVFEKAGFPTNTKVLRSVLGVTNALLSGKRGGNTFVQESVFHHLSREANDNNFVNACKRFLKRSMKDMKIQGQRSAAEKLAGERSVPDDDFLEQMQIAQETLRVLQLMCEGHYKNNQDFLRDQQVHRHVDLVGETADYFGMIWRWKKDSSTVLVMMQTLDTLTEFVQGPCKENQDTIVAHGFLTDAVSVLAEFSDENFSLAKREMLKDKVVITMQALLECRHDQEMHSQVKNIIKTNHHIIKENMLRVYMDFLQAHNNIYQDHCEPFPMVGRDRDTNVQWESALSLGFSLYHLLQAVMAQDQNLLKDLQPNLKKQKNMMQKYFASHIFSHSCGRKQSDKRPFTNKLKHPEDLVYIDKRSLKMNKLKPSKLGEQCYSEAWEFYKQHSASVEVVLGDGQLVRIQFPKPPMCGFLSKASKERVEGNIRRTTANQRVSDLFDQREAVLDEMDNLSRSHWRTLHIPVVPWVLAKGALFQSLSFVTAVILNFILLGSYRSTYDNCNDDPSSYVKLYLLGHEFSSEETLIMMDVFGALLLITSGTTYLSYVISHGTLICIQGLKQWLKNITKRSNRKIDKTHKTHHKAMNYVGGMRDTMKKAHTQTNHSYIWLTWVCTVSFVKDPAFMYYTLHFSAAVVGFTVNPLLYALHLAGIFLEFPELQRVLDSVLKPGKVLTLTLILFVFLCYAFSLVGYMYFSGDYPTDSCDEMMLCFRTTIDHGFKHDGGIGGYLTQIETLDKDSGYETARFLYDHLFNVLLLILLLNIVFGVVIDTFADMRNQTDALQDDKTVFCTVCSCPSARFENVGRGFDYHIKYEHNMWDYYALFAYLIKKNPLEFTGIESYLYTQITQKDPYSIFPVNKSLTLESTGYSNLYYELEEFDDPPEAPAISVADAKLNATVESLNRVLARLEKLAEDQMPYNAHHDAKENPDHDPMHPEHGDEQSPKPEDAAAPSEQPQPMIGRESGVSTASEF